MAADPHQPLAPRAALVFPGQGSQRPAMARSLLERSPAAREALAEASDLLGRDLTSLTSSREIKAEKLAEPVNAHLALVALGLACWRALTRERGLAPVLLAGHSLGEITALACAQALPLDQALALARKRGELLERAAREKPGRMAAILGLAAEEVAAACQQASDQGLVLAVNYNAPSQTVIAGEPQAVQAALALCQARGARVAPLNTATAFHTPLVAGAAAPLFEFAQGLDWRTPAVPVVSSRTARPHDSPRAMAASLALQLVWPVRWTATLGFCLRAGVKRIISAAPGQALNRLTSATAPEIEALSWQALWPESQPLETTS